MLMYREKGLINHEWILKTNILRSNVIYAMKKTIGLNNVYDLSISTFRLEFNMVMVASLFFLNIWMDTFNMYRMKIRLKTQIFYAKA